MNRQQAIDLFAELRPREIAAVWSAARPLRPPEMRRGLYLGRAGGLPAMLRAVVRRVVGRDYFAKMILEGWGVNVRVAQDGTHAPLPSPLVPGGFKVDLPFRLGAESLDYGFHAAGRDLGFPGGLAGMRDFLRALDFRSLTEVLGEATLGKVGARRGVASEAGELVIGYIAPLGVRALQGSPFGMCWWRDVTEPEVESARAYLRTFRLLDASCGDAAG